MWGGGGADTFVFQPGYGDDFVEDFEAGIDTVQLVTMGVGDFASLMAMASDATGDTVIDFGGGDTVTLIGVEIDDLSAGDFIL